MELINVIVNAWEQEGLEEVELEKLIIGLGQEEDTTDVSSSQDPPAALKSQAPALITEITGWHCFCIEMVCDVLCLIGHRRIGVCGAQLCEAAAVVALQ